MKQFLFATIAFTFTCITAIAQKSQVIKINNSLIALSIEANSISWNFYPRSSDPEVELKLQSLRVPVSVNQYLTTFGRKKNNSVGIQIGGYLDYLLNAKENNKNVDNAINKIYISGFAGLKFK